MKKTHITLSMVSIALFLSCEKEWLGAKRDLNAVVPTTLADMRAILRNATSPSMFDDFAGIVQSSSDDGTVTDDVFAAAPEQARNIFTWQSNIYTNPVAPVLEWDNSYRQIFNANVVLEGISNIPRNSSNADEWDDILGSALFFRAKAFYNLAQVFAPPYDSERSPIDLGIPLRLGSNPHLPTTRNSVQETYDRILADLVASTGLLQLQPVVKVDASRQAALALLARCLLTMRKYGEAGRYADSALMLYDSLIDYNALSAPTDSNYPLEEMNSETIFYSELQPLNTFDGMSRSLVNPDIFALYESGDLRKELYFRSTGSFRGNYSGNASRFSGLATDELFLIRAECNARQGNVKLALEDLNHLLIHRHVEGSYRPITTVDADDLLVRILQERRKELLFRGLRWSDLRRLNQENEHAITLRREHVGTVYELLPNSHRYVLPIPEYIIQFTGIQQNIR